MGAGSGQLAGQIVRGIYRKGSWAFVEKGNGERDVMLQGHYDAAGILPPYAELMTEEEFHENVLAHRLGERSA